MAFLALLPLRMAERLGRRASFMGEILDLGAALRAGGCV